MEAVEHPPRAVEAYDTIASRDERHRDWHSIATA
jgi:hypothetical protein